MSIDVASIDMVSEVNMVSGVTTVFDGGAIIIIIIIVVIQTQMCKKL